MRRPGQESRNPDFPANLRLGRPSTTTRGSLGALDAVVFGGGIGENAPDVRSRICSRLGVLGISVDETRNIATIGIEGDISDSEGRASLLVVSVNEMQIIADVASQVMEVA